MKTQEDSSDIQNSQLQINGEKIAASNGWQQSALRWQQLEKLLDDKPGSPAPQPERHKYRDRLVIAGLAAAYTLAICNSNIMPSYDQTARDLANLPVIASIGAAVVKATVHAQQSMITGIVDQDTLTAALYWTLDLKNTSGFDQEAQAEITLPPGAVVSRATLWVDGIPQEAAFNTTSRVIGAYDWIAVRHRDPLLVTYKDDRTILIKASPVPANGNIMRIRLGITAPLTEGGILTMPHLASSNFGEAETNQLHLEGKTQMLCASDKVTTSQGPGIKPTMTANLSGSELSSLRLVSMGAAKNGDFAVRATHSLPGSYIFSRMPTDTFPESPILERKRQAPQGRIVKSESAAHRVSTLWAAGEVKRLAELGKSSEAEALAQVYRIVSPVSGAVVMEKESDYTAQGLSRDQYMLSVPGKTPIASGYGQVAPPLGQIGAAPILQGATNGGIAPQSRDANLFSGREATQVTGVNTAGTVRVNNWATLNEVGDSAAGVLQTGSFLAAFFFALRGLVSMFKGRFQSGLIDQARAITFCVFGLCWMIALPLLGAYKLIKFARSKLKQTDSLSGALRKAEVQI